MTLAAVMSEIESSLREGGEWCSLAKAQTLAAVVLAIRPRVTVEIGVWQGGSLLPILIALRHAQSGRAAAIDPWARDASVVGQEPEHAKWWGQVDHEAAYHRFVSRLRKHRVEDICDVCRCASDAAVVPDRIDFLHIDGNHADQAVRDVMRFAPAVRSGGFLCFDDENWVGGHVGKAIEMSRDLGFDALYPLGTGVMTQRKRGGRP